MLRLRSTQAPQPGGECDRDAMHTYNAQLGVEVGTAQEGLGYTGEWQTGYIDLNLLYLRARWYAAQVGRFTAPDTIVPDFRNPQSINLYAYSFGNPTTYIDPSGYGPEWWERMLQDDTWRTVLFDSSARHNTTAMPDLDFAALMAAIIRVESGAIHGFEVDYETAVLVKSLEIWYDRTLYPWLFGGIVDQLGYQTEGISNIRVRTIANLRRGLVEDASGNLVQTGIEVYDYSGEPLPGMFPFPGLTAAQQINLLSRFTSFALLNNYSLDKPLVGLVHACIDFSVLLRSVRQDQNIEYLAANLEAGTIRAGWEGAQPTAEVLSWWHHQGIAVMKSEEELRNMGFQGQDLEDALVTQGRAQGYWDNLVSWIMEEALGLLSQ